MLVPLVQERRRKVRSFCPYSIPSIDDTLLLSLFDDVFRDARVQAQVYIRTKSITKYHLKKHCLRSTVFAKYREVAMKKNRRGGEGIEEIDRDEFSPSHPVYRMGK